MHACVKDANEAPADLKSHLQRAWACFPQDRLDSCTHTVEYRACLFGLCFFHALVLGRRRFGQQGWSRPYGFNTGDLKICADVLTSYINKAPKGADGRGIIIPWADLRYILGEIMYGGHITDFWDRRTNTSYLLALVNKKLLKPGAELASGFPLPTSILDHDGYVAHVKTALPTETPVLFGLHPNAEIRYLTSTADRILGEVMRLRGSTSDSSNRKHGASGKETGEILNSLEQRLPKL